MIPTFSSASEQAYGFVDTLTKTLNSELYLFLFLCRGLI